MSIRQTTAPEAHATLTQHPDAVYLDVRTEEEFAAGHPAGARNVPILFLDPATRQAKPNPDFVAVVERNFPRTTKLIVGCQMGGRSQTACERLAEAGFVDLANVQGGFGGVRNTTGRASVPGWRDEGLPVELGTPPGAGYADLRGKR